MTLLRCGHHLTLYCEHRGAAVPLRLKSVEQRNNDRPGFDTKSANLRRHDRTRHYTLPVRLSRCGSSIGLRLTNTRVGGSPACETALPDLLA
jgi:hypothetical protein